jgi:thiol-disulfide isomerase/thioredoxin
MYQNLPKICPSCRQKDMTSFSTCRFCGTRYDAIIPKQKSEFDERIILKLSAIALLIGIIFWFIHIQQSQKEKSFASVIKNIQTINRPRLLELYSPTCGACQAYEPIIQQCQSKYGATIDFQRLNIKEKSNRHLVLALWLTAIPKTYIFNRKGEIVNELEGCLNATTLDKYLQDPKLLK